MGFPAPLPFPLTKEQRKELEKEAKLVEEEKKADTQGRLEDERMEVAQAETEARKPL
eukprot:gene4351-12843_t